MRLRQKNNETPAPWGARAIVVDEPPPMTHLQLRDSTGCVCLGCGGRYGHDDLDAAWHHGTTVCITVMTNDQEEILL